MSDSRDVWSTALNLVDDKVQDLKLLGFAYLSRRPYRSELPESNDAITYTLFVDPVTETVRRAVVQAKEHGMSGRTFAHGFDQHRDGRALPLSVDDLREFQ